MSLPRQRVALLIQYLGTNFAGWQRQLHQRTIQGEIEDILSSIQGFPVIVHGAGRTDSGVHAAGMVAHFDITGSIPPQKWAVILNSRLPKDILIRASAPVSADWHARFSASYRRYRYTIYTASLPNLFSHPFYWHYYQAPLEEKLIQEALEPLLGNHDLRAFQRAGSKRQDSFVEVQEVACEREEDFIYVEIQAKGFLYGMVRLLVGMLVQVGQRERTLQDFTRLWRQQQRHEVKHSAPAKGLCFLRVGYPEHPFPPELWFDTQPKFRLTR
jgi:tRNA pseudouridine38-40 synthase